MSESNEQSMIPEHIPPSATIATQDEQALERDRVRETIVSPLRFNDDGKVLPESVQALTTAQWKHWIWSRIVEHEDPFFLQELTSLQHVVFQEPFSLISHITKALTDTTAFDAAIISTFDDLVNAEGRYPKGKWDDIWDQMLSLSRDMKSPIPALLSESLFRLAVRERAAAPSRKDWCYTSTGILRLICWKGGYMPSPEFWATMLQEERALLTTKEEPIHWDRWNHHIGLIVRYGLKLDEDNLVGLISWLSEQESVFEAQRLHHLLGFHVFCSIRCYRETHSTLRPLSELFPNLIDWHREGAVQEFLLDFDGRARSALQEEWEKKSKKIQTETQNEED